MYVTLKLEENWNDTLSSVEVRVAEIGNWVNSDTLKLNQSKTELIVFSWRKLIGSAFFLPKSCHCHTTNTDSILNCVDEEIFKTQFQDVVTYLVHQNVLLFDIIVSPIRHEHRQNSAARLVTWTSKREHIIPVLCQYHWLPVRYRLLYKFPLCKYKVLNGAAQTYLGGLV